MRRATVPVVLTVAALALAACGGGSSGGSELPTVGASPTTSAPATTTAPTSSAPAASATPATDPSPWTALPTIPNGPNKGLNEGIVLASSVASTPEEQEAVKAYVAYWTTLAKIGSDGRGTKAQISAVAASTAGDSLLTYATALKKNGHRTIGWASLNVTDVAVGKDLTLIQACVDNGSYDIVAATGRRLEAGHPAYDANAVVKTVSGRPVVTFAQTRNRTKRCPGGPA